ncbi:MAG: NADP-dependent oxidoreductase [Deltaproteobacteria bacterium]|nr:NADP-dependent oxidoreductase [Deltaproteobacteria bacterium]
MKTQPGHRVLIHAGAGGVGTVAIQLAKHLGAWVATTCSPRNTELVKSLGADQVIDYTTQDFTRAVADLDGVFDMLGGETRLKSFSVLKPGGVLCSIGGLIDVATAREFGLGWPLRVLIGLANRKHDRAARIRGASWSYLFMRPDGAQLAHLASLVEAGQLRPVLDKTYPLADIEAAYQYVASSRARGKVVLTM